MLAAGLTALPGLYLLNQDWQILPTPIFVGDFHVNERPIRQEYIVGFSLGLAATALICASICLSVAFHNYRRSAN